MTIQRPVRTAQAAAIAALEDPVLRNLWITQAYADFAHGLTRLVGNRDLTWCGFGVWASSTAGTCIRQEEVWPAIVGILAASGGHHAAVEALNRELHDDSLAKAIEHNDVLHAFDGVLDQVSAQIATGNGLVFAELGPIFARLVEAAESGRLPEPRTGPAAEAFLADIGAVAADAAAPEPGLLLGAFRSYLAASAVPEGPERAQLVLAGNIGAVAHEQQRLDAAVRASLDAGAIAVERLAGRVMGTHEHHHALQTLRSIASRAVAAVEHAFTKVWEDASTALLMRFLTPDEHLHLGLDVPRLDGVRFPPELTHLADGTSAIYSRFDRTNGTMVGSRAEDWAVIGDRLNYIVNMFRSRQQHAVLMSPPFTHDQVSAMEQLRLPAGPFTH